MALFGVKWMQIDGITLKVKGSVTYNVGGEKREAQMGSSPVPLGYSVTYQVPKVAGTLSDGGDIDQASIKAIKGATLVFGLQNGKLVTLTNATFVGEGEATADTGEFPVEFNGDSCVEIVSLG